MRAVVLAIVVAAWAGVAHAQPGPTSAGWAAYDRFCLACHGAGGDGRGPAAPWLWPRPRDFTQGSFKWVSTDDASRPAREDLIETVRWGAPGTAMHGFGASLDEATLGALADLVLAWAGVAPSPPGRPLATVRTSAGDDAARARGAIVWQRSGCASCHGADGRAADGALPLLASKHGPPARPYDLTAGPVRRPRPRDDRAAREAAVIATLRRGVGGTAMPAFAMSDADAADLAAFVVSLAPAETTRDIGDLPREAIDLDALTPATRGGYRPGAPDDPDGAPFGHTIALQGEPPPSLAPASLSSRQCARCHAKQVREWTGSMHARAGSPGLLGQTQRMTDGSKVESCLRCHAPLAEQQPTLRAGQRGGDDRARAYTANAAFDPELQREGLTCAACHVRDWTRHGPPAPAPSLLTLPGYPLRPLAVFERADLCLACHQLPVRTEVAGRPLLDTYREWLLGPYMPRGVQCQHCHMPNREHTWKGVHDPDTFRQGIAVAAVAVRGATGTVTVRARVTNVGAGHYLPTTPTPAAWLEITLEDDDGRAIAGAQASRRIGRHLRFADGAFEEVEDTRIPPGASLELAQGWRGDAVARAVRARVRVRVRPDDYYEGLYKARLRGKLTPDIRAMFEQALADAEASPYVAYDQTFAIVTR